MGIGCGSTDFDTAGTKLIFLREGIAWHTSPVNAFVPGINVIFWGKTSSSAIGAHNITTGIEVTPNLTWNTPTIGLGIGGYIESSGGGSNRTCNQSIVAVAIYKESLDSTSYVSKRNSILTDFSKSIEYNARAVVLPFFEGFPTGPRIHYVVYPDAVTTVPQQEDVIQEWPGTATTYGYERAPEGSGDFTFSADASALTALTTYKIAYCWYDGLNYSDLSFATFTTGDGSIPLLSNVILYSITSTTARPRVTITF